MGIKPRQHGIKVFFEQNHSFRVPKYQRGYAWEDHAVSDFLSDIGRCLKTREAGSQTKHFFGGVVAARADVKDSNRTEYEVIDGQQRLASFVLLIARLTQKMESVLEDMDADGGLSTEEETARRFLSETLTQLRSLYLTYRDNFGMDYVEAVAMIERFVFRYKTIGNAHISPMTKVYEKHAKAIRGAPGTYKLKSLRDELTVLLNVQVPVSLFRAKLGELRYVPRGGGSGNTAIRYLLLSIEDHRDWIDDGAAGVPKCKDKTSTIDFPGTTIEHVYPRSAEAGDRVQTLEPLKDTLGNLTIFGPNEQRKAANKPFGDKQAILKKSKIRMNREIGGLAAWDVAAVKARSKSLIDLAVKIFVP